MLFHGVSMALSSCGLSFNALIQKLSKILRFQTVFFKLLVLSTRAHYWQIVLNFQLKSLFFWCVKIIHFTEMKFFVKDIFSTCEEHCSFLKVRLDLIKKSFMKIFIFRVVSGLEGCLLIYYHLLTKYFD